MPGDGSNSVATGELSAGNTTQIGLAAEYGFDGDEIETKLGESTYMIVARQCGSKGVSTGTGFAIDSDHIVTTWSALANDTSKRGRAIDDRPWIRDIDNSWVRGKVVGASRATNIALLEVSAKSHNPETTLEFSKRTPKLDGWVGLLSYPALTHGDLVSLGATVTHTRDSIASEDTSGDKPEAKNAKASDSKPSDYKPGDGKPKAGKSNAAKKSAKSNNQTTAQRVKAVKERQVKSIGFVVRTSVSSRTGDGTTGSPAFTDNGKVLGMLSASYGNEVSWWASDADTISKSVQRMMAGKDKPIPACKEGKKMPMRWAVMLDDSGTAQSAARLSSNKRLKKLGRVGHIDVRWASFLREEQLAPVLLGSYGSESKAKSVAAEAARILKADPAELSVGLYPAGIFKEGGRDPFKPKNIPTTTEPPETTVPQTTVPVETTAVETTVATTAPPTTAPRTTRVTTTTAKPTTTAKKSPPPATEPAPIPSCGGGGQVTAISGVPAGDSARFRSSPSAAGTVVATASNGYQLKKLGATANDGIQDWTKVELPTSPPTCAWVPSVYV